MAALKFLQWHPGEAAVGPILIIVNHLWQWTFSRSLTTCVPVRQVFQPCLPSLHRQNTLPQRVLCPSMITPCSRFQPVVYARKFPPPPHPPPLDAAPTGYILTYQLNMTSPILEFLPNRNSSSSSSRAEFTSTATFPSGFANLSLLPCHSCPPGGRVWVDF